MKVVKFGGSSLASAERIKNACDIVASDPERRIMVVSAPGKATKQDTKVTDLLIACAERFLADGNADKECQAVVARFAEIQKGLGLPESVLTRISENLESLLAADTKNQSLFIDGLKAAGEDNCAWLVAEAFKKNGIDASYVNPGEAGMLLSAEYGAARVLEESYKNLSSLRDRKEIVVFPGFFGVTPDGDIATFPRGGSDITGAVLAAAVGADRYENFTDVDSVFSVDPSIVPEVGPITELTYREMRELAYSGFQVFHDEAIAPVVEASIPICIKNSNRPEAPGTLVLPEREYRQDHAVGIAASAGFCTISVSKYMMNRELGFGRRLLQILEEAGISYEHTPSGIDNMSVVLRDRDFDASLEKTTLKRIETELEAAVSVERGLSLIMVVGEGMHYSVGIAAKATAALAAAKVNIEMINQGSSEISMMFGVKTEDSDQAIRSLYGAFFAE